MTTRTQVEAKSTSTPIPAMPPAHSGLLSQQEQEESDRSLLSSEDRLRSPSSPTPPPINPSAGHNFGSMAIGSTTSPVLQRMAIANKNLVQRQENAEEEEKEEEESIQTKAISPLSVPSLQRQMNSEEEEKNEEEEAVQTKAIAPLSVPVLQRQMNTEEEEEKTIQAKALPGQGVPSFVQRYRQRVTQTEVSRPPGVPILQRKLVIGQPNDKYEQEADRVADQVMRMPEPNPVGQRIVNPMRATLVQRMCSACEEEELQPKPLASQITPLVQREAELPEEEEGETVQAKPMSDSGMPVIQKQEAEPEEKEEKNVQTKSVNYQDSSLVQRQRENPGEISSVTSTLEARLNASRGGGQPLPEQTRTFMESRFGQDFSGVRVHTDGEAEQMNRVLNAQAFTHGQDVYFGEGYYRPASSVGNRLLAHELTHVVQQTGVGSLQSVGFDSIQRAKKKATYVPYQIHVEQPMTQEEFKVAAMRQVFGGVLENLTWWNLKDSYVPENSPYTLRVDVQLLKQHRSQTSKEGGISVGEGGGITGAKERAKTFHAGPVSDEKSALMQEIDRRYFEAVGDKTKTKIKPGEKGKAELWRMIRDEVLFQHDYIANLPPKVKELIKFSIKGRDLTPADYDKLFAIAKKIEKMPTGQVSDYASKVTGATTDLNVFEASLDKYIAEMVEREKRTEEREKVHTKLIGLEEVYKKYRLWKTLTMTSSIGAIAGRYPGGGGGGSIVTARTAEKERQELETQLQAHDFKGIDDFKAWIERYEKAFELGAANIAKDVLAKFSGKLYRESERYKNPAEVSSLHQKLGGVRSNYAIVQQANLIMQEEYAKQAPERERARLPGQGHLQPSPTARFKEWEAKGYAARGAAAGEVKNLAKDHPIFEEEGLPDDKKLDKVALATASENQLGGLLQAQIQRRMQDIEKAKAQIDDKPELIYKMEKLMPQFYAQQGIRPDSIHDMIIQDKMKSDAIIKIVKGLAVALVAIALAVISFGTATPAIVAAGAAIAGAGLGAYQAYESYQEYVEEKKLADVGFAKDPSLVWLVIAVAGAALDMAAAVKAVSALGKAAKALEAGGDLAEFTKVVRALEKANKIDAKIARAAEKAAAARTGFAEASGELTEVWKVWRGRMASVGPYGDPAFYQALIKMARQAIKTKAYDAQKFIEEIKLARVKAGLGDLAPEELAKAKQAWEEAKALEAVENARYEKLLAHIGDASKLDTLIAAAGDIEKLERLLKTFPVAELETVFAKLKDTGRLVIMLDHVGTETGANMIRNWMAAGDFAKMNQFMERLAGGIGKELAEKAAISGKSLIIDSNTAIALMKDADPALRATMNAGEKARVAYIKSLPTNIELRVGNVTVGEIQGGILNVKGVPIEVARESTEYQKVLGALAKEKVGKPQGFADRGLIADSFFARTEPGVIPRFLTADQNAVKKLAGMATPKIDVNKIGGYPGLLRTYGTSGFNVIIEGHTLTVIPVP